MKLRLLTPAALLCAGALQMASAEEGWGRDFEAAKQQAQKEGKDLLIDFTGSDWCGWCIRLHKEVFSQEAFQTAAPKKFVLVTLDFPRDQSLVTETEKAQNEKLQQQFSVQGFPTIFLCDSQGRPYAQTGYQEGGAESYVSHLDELQKNRVTRDEKFAAAEESEGVEKARLLVDGLKALPENLLPAFYQPQVDAVRELDKEDATGFVKSQNFKAALEGLREELTTAMRGGKLEDGPGAVDAFLEKEKPEGADKQQVMLFKLGFLVELNKFDEALQLLEDVAAVDPQSPLAQRAQEIRPQIEQIKAQKAADSGEEKAE